MQATARCMAAAAVAAGGAAAHLQALAFVRGLSYHVSFLSCSYSGTILPWLLRIHNLYYLLRRSSVLALQSQLEYGWNA